MKKILVATKNKYKVQEISRMLFGYQIEVKSLFDYPNIPDVIEDLPTFEENAKKKALHAAKRTGFYSLADDSGLKVDALDGRPGVFSARYAGLSASFRDNNIKLLQEMKDVPDQKRTAEFVCVMVCTSPKGETWSFEGKVKGMITRAEEGYKGFGYDPVFIPEGFNITFAQMEPGEKDKISHRAMALKKFKMAINEIFGFEGRIL